MIRDLLLLVVLPGVLVYCAVDALPAPIALCVLVALLVHVAQALRTRQFVPHPALARGRVAVTGLAAVACALFALGFGLTWWVVHDHDRVADRTVELATTGTSPAALVTTGLGLLAAALTLAAAHWRRDLAPPVLPIAWFAVGMCWFVSSGATIDVEGSGERHLGLHVATAAMLLVTAAGVVGSLARVAERRRRRTWRPEPRATTPGRVVPGDRVVTISTHGL